MGRTRLWITRRAPDGATAAGRSRSGRPVPKGAACVGYPPSDIAQCQGAGREGLIGSSFRPVDASASRETINPYRHPIPGLADRRGATREGRRATVSGGHPPRVHPQRKRAPRPSWGPQARSPETPSGEECMVTNERLIRVQWGDCDPAGIVYYPRYFEWFDASTILLF